MDKPDNICVYGDCQERRAVGNGWHFSVDLMPTCVWHAEAYKDAVKKISIAKQQARQKAIRAKKRATSKT
jgi:hypothetical protein